VSAKAVPRLSSRSAEVRVLWAMIIQFASRMLSKACGVDRRPQTAASLALVALLVNEFGLWLGYASGRVGTPTW
jgi:hypothetical protein